MLDLNIRRLSEVSVFKDFLKTLVALADTKDFADPDQAWRGLAKQFGRLCRHVGQV